MTEIRLSPDGVFPIVTACPKGQKPEVKTGFPISGTIQGEGKLAGIPSLFIRFSGCNLRCSWHMEDGTSDICDTPYASHKVVEVIRVTVDEVMQSILANTKSIRHIVVTGGEPSLQPVALAELCDKLRRSKFHVTVETNGTLFKESWANSVDLFSIAPKLKSSDPECSISRSSGSLVVGHQFRRKAIESFRDFIDFCRGDPYTDYQFKFVIAAKADEIEIKEIIDLCHVAPHKVTLMPLGSTPNVLKKSKIFTCEMAVKNGWRYSPRLQVDVFGNVGGT